MVENKQEQRFERVSQPALQNRRSIEITEEQQRQHGVDEPKLPGIKEEHQRLHSNSKCGQEKEMMFVQAISLHSSKVTKNHYIITLIISHTHQKNQYFIFLKCPLSLLFSPSHLIEVVIITKLDNYVKSLNITTQYIYSRMQKHQPKYLEYYGNSPSDVALSSWEYEDFVDAVNDDRLSPSTLFKFKLLYRYHSFQLFAVPILMFPVAYAANKWLVGFANRGMGSSRFNFYGMALFYPIALYFGYNVPIHRKLYTEILSDPSDDGEYIRDCVAYYKPGLWKKISTQLEALNLQFRQNIRTKKLTQFPQNFVSSHSIY